ncbi:lycopene cyclase domain-containing protein [Actinopolymorpha sp. B11F2]|uniref:lycopene cyclase domain-containing protein n=1 Tax=Actinopolymorpha sp. B11F2 TaxID=3160862 RepID=UPI0032E39752
MPEYTVAAALSVPAVVALELLVLRTHLFRRPAYWLTVVIVLGFQILVDGWLTKLSAPIVVYAPRQASGIRFPWDIPVEDFAFGFSLMTLTILLWERLARRPQNEDVRLTPRRSAFSHPTPNPTGTADPTGTPNPAATPTDAPTPEKAPTPPNLPSTPANPPPQTEDDAASTATPPPPSPDREPGPAC